MADLTIYDPFRERSLMRDMLEDFALNSLFDTRWPAMPTSALPLNMRDENDAVIVEASLPGFEDKDIVVRVEGNLLTISAHHEDQREEKDGNRWYIREHRMSQVQRTVTLPATVKSNKADAHLKNGLLTVRLPKTDESLIHKVAVKAKQLLPSKSG